MMRSTEPLARESTAGLRLLATVFLSAGFDGDWRILANLNYTPDGFELSPHIVQWSKAAGNLSIVSVLEGGYNCEALAEDVSVHPISKSRMLYLIRRSV